MTSYYKQKNPFENREAESRRIRSRYPDRVPVIVENDPKDNQIPALDKVKYLVPNDLSMGQFIYVIRKRIKLAPEKAMFVMINGTLPPTSMLIGQIFNDHHDEDGFLYATIAGESTFGA